MNTAAAEEEKAKGAISWSEGNYNEAITHYTAAIDSSVEKDFLKVVYSNRSAAYLKIKKYPEALTDACKCIELDGNWPKGYTRKGDALYLIMKYTEAFNAYNSAKRLAPSDVSIIDKCEQTMKAIRIEAERSETVSGRRSEGGWGSSSGTNSSNPPEIKGTLGRINKYLRLILFASAVLYLLPFRSYRLTCFSFVISMISLYSKYGFPKFSMDYATRILPDPNSMKLFLSCILMVTSPYLIAIASIFLFELSNVTNEMFKYVKQHLPTVESQVKPLLNRFLPASSNQDFSTLLAQANVDKLNYVLIQNSALCEVMQGIFLVVELALPTRNVMTLFVWWQYLQMRYMMDDQQGGHVKAAFNIVDEKISAILAHRMCPKIAVRGYDALKKILSDKVKPPTSTATTGGSGGFLSSLVSKCSVM